MDARLDAAAAGRRARPARASGGSGVAAAGRRRHRLGHDARPLRHVRVALGPLGGAAHSARLGDAQPLAVPRAHRLAARAATAGAHLRPAARTGRSARRGRLPAHDRRAVAGPGAVTRHGAGVGAPPGRRHGRVDLSGTNTGWRRPPSSRRSPRASARPVRRGAYTWTKAGTPTAISAWPWAAGGGCTCARWSRSTTAAAACAASAPACSRTCRVSCARRCSPSGWSAPRVRRSRCAGRRPASARSSSSSR